MDDVLRAAAHGFRSVLIADVGVLSDVATIRAAVTVPLDGYVESPDDLGGIVRLHDVPELIRIAAPVNAKFGLRNAPSLYPSGEHLRAAAASLGRERVRRARLVMELLGRSGYEGIASRTGADGLTVPVV